MFGKIKELLFGKPVDMKELVAKGALILDVRTAGEYRQGHIKGSVNVPLNVLPKKLSKLKKNQVIITCCASGMRSASAKSILKSKGFEAHNGGSWHSLQRKLR